MLDAKILGAIYWFEVRFHLTRALPYLVGSLLGLLAFGAISSDVVQIGGSIGNVNRNAPLVIINMLAFLTPIATFIITAFVASAAVRDYEQGTYPLFFSKPMKAWDYLLGRFGGSLTVSVLSFLLPCLGIAIGTFMPWIDPERLGPFELAPYAFGMLVMVLPTTLFIAAVFFTLANWSRSFFATYLGLVGFFVAFFLAGQLMGDMENLAIGAMLDPFGLSALNEQTRYWTVVEQNGSLPQFSGLLLWNRLAWSGLGLGIFVLGGLRFKPTQTDTGAAKLQTALRFFRRKKNRGALTGEATESATGDADPQALTRPTAQPAHSGMGYTLRQFLAATKFEMGTVFRSVPFLIILAFGLFNVLGSADFYDRQFGTQTYPVTRLMLQVIEGSYSFLLLIIAIFYAGELMWRDRTQKTSDVVDATPAPSGVFLLSKLTALWAVILAFMATGGLATMCLQLIKGYTNLEPLLYLKGLVLSSAPFLLIGLLALVVQVLTNQKFIGYMVMIVYLISTITLELLDFNHNLYQYGSSGAALYSDMNGYGHFMLRKFSFFGYWSCFGLALVALAAFFWVRGHETSRRFRTALAKQRLRTSGAWRTALAIGLVGFVAMGTWIFYNTNVLNEYVAPDEAREQAADYERQYRQYLDEPMPRIQDVQADVDIYPYQRKMDARVVWQLANESDVPIDRLYWTLNPAAEIHEWNLPPHEVELDDERLNFRILKLNRPLERARPSRSPSR